MPKAPTLQAIIQDLEGQRSQSKPIAFILAGHNGSGKSTLWNDRLAPVLRRPLINADRLITSILPAPIDKAGRLVPWAAQLRDQDERWQRLAQDGVASFLGLVTDQKMSFGYETVFSHWKELPGGKVESKVDLITNLQKEGYYVVLLFVGMVSAQLSIARVDTRKRQGGHTVEVSKLISRFPRTQKAVGHAAGVADMTIMFDNSATFEKAFRLVRVQHKKRVRYDCRDPQYAVEEDLLQLANRWLEPVIGKWLALSSRKSVPRDRN